ncbi:hypothetical protein [Aeromonas caviae]|uniref:Uncharacterized protein n=1 Tax=Aeromonas caviae TaxID=648 RepID=A0ABD0BD15_AERCA|nr:hypothetical protein [Aeromonas caviae]BCR30355.1 hypothetical protein KAM376_33610 [Aeromonas caviae]GJA82004.1 hypothetical protein KAM355_25640 [Aeromonas caviae]GJB00607.1 hypothetical protein KAM359_40140 [Aeromonas caviae]GJB13561.1 hypothetical protein KAM362_41210 [Aeromonas caviae]GJB22520.1 hypothetical protein KAM365_02700 [Aeromonas caviae]
MLDFIPRDPYQNQDINNFINGSCSPLIQDIKSKRARNLLRGISDPTNFSITKTALSKIKNSCDYSDYKKAVTYVRTNKFFKDNLVGQLNNCFCPKGLPESIIYTLKEICQQIDNNSNQLVKITEKAISLLSHLKNNEFNEALDCCHTLIDEGGVSIFLIRKLSFITNRYQALEIDDKKILEKIDNLKIRINISNASFIEEAVTQLSNLRTAHLAVHKRINDIKDDRPFVNIAKSFIKPIPSDEDEFIRTLNGYYSFSLFDAFLYIQITNSMNLPFIAPYYIYKNHLQSLYNDISRVDFSPEKMYLTIDENTGYYYLRECFLFPEQSNALKFLSIHGHYYTDWKNTPSLTPFAKNNIEKYFNGISRLEHICCAEMDNVEVNYHKYDKKHCGMLENSTALIHILNKNEGDIGKDEEVLFVKLMSFTRDIGEICKNEYLERIADSAEDLSLKLVARCLVSINNKKQYAEYEFRSITQEYCLTKFNGNLNKLLKHLFEVSPAVAEHFILNCNETFLSTLFHLMDKPVDALKVRADMLHWFGEVTHDERYIDRAKTLRIDIQVNKEKGTIDDSRIYVDSFKFTQWFEDNMVSKLTMTLDNLILSKNKSLVLDWDKKNSNIGSLDSVIEHLLACYHEFCANSIFGIASYLGRRIRHGTFGGTAITEVSDLAKNKEYLHLFDDRDFKLKFDTWLRNYELMIEDLVKTSLQIKSRKKPNGLITTEIDSAIKKQHANQLMYEILSVYSSRTGVLRLPIVIMDYCWRLAESDLRIIRNFLSEKKATHAVFSYTPKNISTLRKREYSKFTQEINLVTSKKFRLMSSWFNKPSYASPSTDIYLLFRAVVSEIKESVSHFTPCIALDERSFLITGGTYYVIYDALYVLIHNAARHGKQNGRILFDVSNHEDRNALKIKLCTELPSVDELLLAQEKIEKALGDADDNAHVVEGNSGIKKLKKMERDGSISNIKFFTNELDLLLSFEFIFELNSRGKYENIDS